MQVVFHAGTRIKDGQLVSSGGRVLGIGGIGADARAAQVLLSLTFSPPRSRSLSPLSSLRLSVCLSSLFLSLSLEKLMKINKSFSFAGRRRQAAAYRAVDAVDWPLGFCRRDIGYRAVARIVDK